MVISGRKWFMAATVFLETSVMPQGTMLLPVMTVIVVVIVVVWGSWGMRW